MRRSRKAAVFGLSIGAASFFCAGEAIDKSFPGKNDFAQMRIEAAKCADLLKVLPDKIETLPNPCEIFADHFNLTVIRKEGENFKTIRVSGFDTPDSERFLNEANNDIEVRDRDGRLMRIVAKISAAVMTTMLVFDLSRGSGTASEKVQIGFIDSQQTDEVV